MNLAGNTYNDDDDDDDDAAAARARAQGAGPVHDVSAITELYEHSRQTFNKLV